MPTALREWFARETGWVLHVERDCARLYKRPADLLDSTRGLPGYDRRRYVLLCLACAVLERADPQITLRVLGERLLGLAADPALARKASPSRCRLSTSGASSCAVCRTLLDLGVLQRVAGDEEGYVSSSRQIRAHDALYDVQRRVLAGVLAGVRGPSTWSPMTRRRTSTSALRALVDRARSGHRRRPPDRHTPRSVAAAARRSGGLHRRRSTRTSAPTSSTSAARWRRG